MHCIEKCPRDYRGLTDLAPWAVCYRKGMDNPGDAYWLRPGKYVRMTYIDDRMTWSYEDSVDEPDMDRVAAALLWEECRDIKTVTLRFDPAKGTVPGPDEISVCCKHSHSVWEDTRRWKFDSRPLYFLPVGRPLYEKDGTLIMQFSSPADQIVKMYVLYSGADGVYPEIEAYGTARWRDPISVDLEWDCGQAGGGELRVHNGEILSVSPLCGLTLSGAASWTETAGRNSLRALVAVTEGPQHSKTQLTLWAGTAKATFYPEELTRNPIWIPSVSVYAAVSGGPAKEEHLASLPGKTVRARVGELPEADLETSVRINFADKPLRMFSKLPYGPVMKIDVPDWLIMGQWSVSAFHLKRWCWPMPDGSYCVSIWPFDKGAAPHKDGNEGAAAIAGESERIVRALGWLGMHDVAGGGIDYWLNGERARPYFKFAEVMGDDALANPYNGYNKTAPGYDQKHASGHGQVLRMIAHHYRLTGNGEWFDKASGRIIGACRAVARLRAEMKRHLTPDCWGYGLLPPSSSGDFGETRMHYAINAMFYSGIKEIAGILKERGYPEADEIRAEAEDFAASLNRAIERSVALCPVKKVGDGSYRRYLTWQPYARGMGAPVDWAADPFYFECVLNGLNFVPDLIDPSSPIVDEMLDMYEDNLYIRANEKPVKNANGRLADDTARLRADSLTRDEEDLLYRGGYGAQAALEMHKRAYLYRDEAPQYIRAVFNSYAAEIDPDRAYTFWEGPKQGGAPDKTFEEAGFIEYIRWMLVFEEGDTLWLARATPRAWLSNGNKIGVSDAPTYFGEVSYEIHSKTDCGVITATVTPPVRSTPAVIALRLRHPDKKNIRSVCVNSIEWEKFDGETVYWRPEPGSPIPAEFIVRY